MAITQVITAIPDAGHRGVDIRTAFVTKQEAFQDALTATTVTELNNLVTQANTLQADVNSKQATASTAATTATTQATNASTSATNAANSATTATTQATNAAASYDAFDDRYLGSKATAPTLDNDGQALLTGALYWDTVIPGMRAWSSTAWVTLPGATAGSITNTPAGTIAATTVQAALNELDTEKAPLASPTFTGRIISLSDTQTGYSSGSIEARSTVGDVYIALHAQGVTAAAIKHTRGAEGVSVVTSTGALAPITALSFNAITGLASVAPIVDGIAAVGTSTAVARQDHVHPTNFTATATDIKMNGAQAVGTLTTFPRADHVHPIDTSRAPLASPTFTGVPLAPTAGAGTNTTQLATTAFTKTQSESIAIGIGQNWQDVTVSRALSTTYTNSTGKPICVIIKGFSSVASAYVLITINGVSIGGGQGTVASSNVATTFIVPNGATYSLTWSAGTPTITNWYELR